MRLIQGVTPISRHGNKEKLKNQECDLGLNPVPSLLK